MSKIKPYLLAALGWAAVGVPAFLSSKTVSHLVDRHPAWAVYIPVVGTVAVDAVRWLEKKINKPAAPAVPPAVAPPAAPTK